MAIWRFTCFSLLLGFFQSSFSELTGGAELNVAVEEGTIIHINTSAGINAQCEVCISQVCQSSVILRNDTSLNFSCSQPEDVFTVQIIRDIGELSDKMKSIIEPKEHHVFQKFNRTFTWNLKPPATRRVSLFFRIPGLRQIPPTDSCPDKHVYTITSENVSVGRFCHNGAIRTVNVNNVVKLSLEVSGGQPLDMKDIGVLPVLTIYSALASIHVVLPEGSSTQEFFTPNPFPENAETVWHFYKPPPYYTDVHILNYTVPTCLQPENIPTMRYFQMDKSHLVKPLNGSQPSLETGYFNISIKNCRISRSDPSSGGLMVHFQISTSKRKMGGAEHNVAVEEGTSIHINTSAGTNTQCKVCISQVCQSSVILRNDTSLNFSCSQPEDVFTVQIIRDIGELSDKMEFIIEPKEHNFFQKFNRTFTWNLKPPATREVHLFFWIPGLRQIPPTDSCPDKHVYTITSENVSVGRFCHNGTIRTVNVNNVVKLSLEVSGGQPLDMKEIIVSLVLTIYSAMSSIHVVLPERSSTQDFFTPNPFPENAKTVWYFNVPHEYYTDVHIINYTVPTCLQPENIPTMRYLWHDMSHLVKPLNGSQLSLETGDFILSLQNCNISWSDSPSEGLMVHFQISASKRKMEHYGGDLPEKQILQIRVVKKDPTSLCVLKMDSVKTNAVIIASGKRYDIESIECNKDELEMAVHQTIECKEWRSCASTTFPITFSNKEICIPGVLKTMTWHLHGPQNSSVELQSPTGGLRYCLPEVKYNSILLLNVSHDNPGITVGQFCPKGTIEKIQIRESKIAVTASVTSFNDWNLENNPFLTYSFIQDISEDYIFTVAPKLDNPTVLVTPAWPSGIKPSSNVSWIINMEPHLKSNLKFMNVSQPKCKEVQTNIAVQTIRSQAMMYSTKKDENINDVLVPESFYLNMTNCKSPTGSFRAMMEITLQSNTKKLLGIILSIVGIVLMIITAVVIWIVLRKKKRNKTPPVSNYNPNAFLPGLHGIPKTQEEEDPHAYEYIDNTLVYSHLLKKEAENEQCKDESGPPLPDRPVGKGESLVTKGRAMVDNELYCYFQGQSTTSGSPKSPNKTSEDEACETRLCEREESP